MGMLTRGLPKFRWFQARPKTAWCCRWVLGSVAVLALAGWVFTTFGQADCWVPKWILITLDEGSVHLVQDRVLNDGDGQSRTLAPAHTRARITTGYFSWRLHATWQDAFLAYFETPGVWWSGSPGGLPSRLIVRVPLWLVFALSAPLSIFAWRHRWVVQREDGRCRTCGYARDGLAARTKCPECGTAPADAKA